MFKKLFKLLVVSGAVIGTGQACTTQSSGNDKKPPQADAGTAADAGTGGGAPGW